MEWNATIILFVKPSTMFFVSQTGMTLLPHRVALHPASRVSTVYLLKTGLNLRITIFKICFLQSVIFTAIYFFFHRAAKHNEYYCSWLEFSFESVYCVWLCMYYSALWWSRHAKQGKRAKRAHWIAVRHRTFFIKFLLCALIKVKHWTLLWWWNDLIQLVNQGMTILYCTRANCG